MPANPLSRLTNGEATPSAQLARGAPNSHPVLLWRCGHPRTPENTQSIGAAGVRCRECRRRIRRESYKRLHGKAEPRGITFVLPEPKPALRLIPVPIPALGEAWADRIGMAA